jgi:type I restriction enzyme S subunit
VSRIGTAVARIDERIPGADLPLLSVSQTRGVLRRSEISDKPHRAESLDEYKVCRKGDIVFNKMSVRAGALGVAKEDGLVTYHYEVMRPIGDSEPRYIAHLMKSHWFVSELVARERGIGAGDQAAAVRTTEVPFRVLRTIDAYIPSGDEQREIADYLDRETARIDMLIAKQEQLIATLRERKRATIAAASVGSFNPLSATGSPSMTVGTAFSIVLGKMLDAGRQPTLDDLTLPYVRAANIQDAGLDLSDVNSMPFLPREAAALDLKANDLLVVEGGASVGTSVALREDLLGWSFQKTVNRARPLNGACGAWLGYVLRTYRDAGVIDTICSGSTFAHLTAEKLRALRIPHIESDRQWKIAAALDDESSRIDALIAKTQRFIELSKERRSALITAAVTGQIDVTGEAA